MTDINVDDFFKDAARALIQLYKTFPRRHAVFVDEIHATEILARPVKVVRTGTWTPAKKSLVGSGIVTPPMSIVSWRSHGSGVVVAMPFVFDLVFR